MHALIVLKWLHTINLAIESAKKSRCNRTNTDKTIVSQISARDKMELIYAKGRIS